MLSDLPDPLDVGDDDDFLYYLREGSEHMRAGRMSEARLALERAYELSPDSARVQNLLGLVYFKLGLLEAAKSVYDRLIREYPDEAPLHVNLGLVLLRQGRLHEAEESLRAALELSPDHRRAHCYLGLVLYRRGDLLRARQHFIRGDAPEYADKVQQRLDAGARASGPSPVELLRAVATEGLELLASADNPLAGVEPVREERTSRDEDAWQTRVGHRFDRPEDALDMESLGSVVESLTPRSPAWRGPTGARPVVIEEGRSTVPPVVPDEIAFGAEGDSLPAPKPLTLVPPSLDVGEGPRGFTVGAQPGAEVTLRVMGTAHVRSSILISAQGRLRVLEGALQSASNPFLRVEGQGCCFLRVPNLAVLVADIDKLFVRASALAGFDGELRWVRGESLGSAVLQLEGRGSALLNAPRRALAAEVSPEAPFYCRRDAFLAWSEGVEGELVDIPGAAEGLVLFTGRGSVIIAGLDGVGAVPS